jgi:hypothetical protein
VTLNVEVLGDCGQTLKITRLIASIISRKIGLVACGTTRLLTNSGSRWKPKTMPSIKRCFGNQPLKNDYDKAGSCLGKKCTNFLEESVVLTSLGTYWLVKICKQNPASSEAMTKLEYLWP